MIFVIWIYDQYGRITSSYIYGIGIDEILQRQSNGAVYYYDYDGLGSVTEIVDSRGYMLEKYDYDIWGNFTIKNARGNTLTQSAVGNTYFFTGREYDATTGLYNYRARWYDAKIGRFISADPIGYNGGINVYAYVTNNPVNYTDPMGLLLAPAAPATNPALPPIGGKKILVMLRLIWQLLFMGDDDDKKPPRPPIKDKYKVEQVVKKKCGR